MILIGMGGNLDSVFGSVYQTAQKAYALLEEQGCKIECSSSWFATAPVPISDQPWYKNRVFSVLTSQTPQELLKTLLDVESKLGRVRSKKNAARVLDLDLLAFDDFVVDNPPDLIVPHPRMHLRSFVLYPLKQINPTWIHPVLKQNLISLIAQLPDNQQIKEE